MQKNKAATLGIILAFSIIGDSHRDAVYTTSFPNPASVLQLSSLDLSDVDIIFRTGRSLSSRLILTQGDGPRFSHVGLIVRVDRSLFVIHAVPSEAGASGGVLLEPLAQFASVANAADAAVYRIKGLTSRSRARIREYAIRQIGKPFDDLFSLTDDRQMYCTELVLKALAAGGVDIELTVPHLRVFMVAEAVVPPDSLRMSVLIDQVRPGRSF